MQLHQRGLDLLMNVQDAVDHVDSLSEDEVRRLLREVNIVISQLLERDIPFAGVLDGQPVTGAWRREQ